MALKARCRQLMVGAAVVLALSTLATTVVFAIWVAMSLEELVRQSDLIVVGELVSVREQASGAADVAAIRVEEVILARSERTTGSELALALPARGRGLASSVAIFYKVGQRGVWFLRRAPESAGVKDVYLADHPQRFQASAEADGVRAFVKSRARR